MPYFEYKGIRDGKYVEDQIEALNNEEAADKLKQQKIIITKLFRSKKKKLKIKKKNPFLLASVRALKLKKFYYLPNSLLL